MKATLKRLTKDFSQIGEKTICNEDSPLYELIREYHEGFLPQDWIFNKFRDITINLYEMIDEYGDDLDVLAEIVDNNIDTYNHDLLEWAKTFSYYADEAKNEGLIIQNTDIMQQLQAGQYLQLTRITHAIYETVKEL